MPVDLGMSILNEKKRLFKAYLSVETKDNQGHVVPIKEIMKTMPSFLADGGPLLYRHKGRPVGKVINVNPVYHNGVPAIEMIGMINDSFDYHDQVWKEIQDSTLKGVSFHGDAKFLDNGDIEVLSGIEVSVTPNPCNPFSLITEHSAIAKEDKELTKGENIIEAIKENNPWAICTATLGTNKGEKFERCVMDLKKKFGIKKDKNEVNKMENKKIKKQEPTTEAPAEQPASNEEKFNALAEAVAELKERVVELASKLEAKPESEVAQEDNEEEKKKKETENEEKKPEPEQPEDTEEKKKKGLEIEKQQIKELIKETIKKEFNSRFEKVPVQSAKAEKKELFKSNDTVKIGRKSYTREDVNKMFQ